MMLIRDLLDGLSLERIDKILAERGKSQHRRTKRAV